MYDPFVIQFLLFLEWQKTWDAWWQDTESEAGFSPLNSVQNASAYSASAYSPFQNKLNSESVKDEEESENPFLPNHSSKIDDSFDIVFENSNKNTESKFEEDDVEEDSTSGGIVFENSNVNHSDLSKKSKPKKSAFAKFNENQSSLEDSSSQVNRKWLNENEKKRVIFDIVYKLKKKIWELSNAFMRCLYKMSLYEVSPHRKRFCIRYLCMLCKVRPCVPIESCWYNR